MSFIQRYMKDLEAGLSYEDIFTNVKDPCAGNAL
jgi:hypothetical protein